MTSNISVLGTEKQEMVYFGVIVDWDLPRLMQSYITCDGRLCSAGWHDPNAVSSNCGI